MLQEWFSSPSPSLTHSECPTILELYWYLSFRPHHIASQSRQTSDIQWYLQTVVNKLDPIIFSNDSNKSRPRLIHFGTANCHTVRYSPTDTCCFALCVWIEQSAEFYPPHTRSVSKHKVSNEILSINFCKTVTENV